MQWVLFVLSFFYLCLARASKTPFIKYEGNIGLHLTHDCSFHCVGLFVQGLQGILFLVSIRNVLIHQLLANKTITKCPLLWALFQYDLLSSVDSHPPENTLQLFN